MKKQISESVNDIKDSLDGATLQQAIEMLHDLARTHGEDATLSIGTESYPYENYEYAYIKVKIQREETDEEYNKRIVQEKYYDDMRKKADLEAYERVKKSMEQK